MADPFPRTDLPRGIQEFLREFLTLHRGRPLSQHLEVEIYTQDVLPDRYRNVPVSTAIARELPWVLDQLAL